MHLWGQVLEEEEGEAMSRTNMRGRIETKEGGEEGGRGRSKEEGKKERKKQKDLKKQ